MTDRDLMQEALYALTYVGDKEIYSDTIDALRARLAQPEPEPVEYQMRMRPTWEVSSWSDWKKCSRDAAEDYAKTPKLHDWEYETRKMYDIPPQREWVGLTDEEIDKWNIVGHESLREFVRAIEAKLKEQNGY